MEIPEMTQEAILHVDSTPDKEYPLRILKIHRENCNMKYITETPSEIWEVMNEYQDERAKILDKAIAILEESL